MASKRTSEMSPEELARKKANAARYRERHSEKVRAANKKRNDKVSLIRKSADGDVIRDKYRSINKRSYAKNKERIKAARALFAKNQKLRGKNTKPAYDLFEEIRKRCAGDFNKDDIVAEAFIMVMEGKQVDEAVKLARRKANKFGNELRFNTTSIDDAFWLDEPADFGDSENCSL